MTDQVNEDQKLVNNNGEEVTLEQAIEATEAPKEEIKYPEWLPEKFKTGAGWEEKLGQSYTELEKVLKEKGKVAPDAYEVDEALKSKVDTEVLEEFNKEMKGATLTQDQYKAVLAFADKAR